MNSSKACVSRLAGLVAVALAGLLPLGCKPRGSTPGEGAKVTAKTDVERVAEGLTGRTAVRGLRKAEATVNEIEKRQAEQMREIEALDASN